MLHLNLLSHKLRREIRLRHAYDMVRNANYLLIIIVIVFTVIFLLTKIFLQNVFTKTIFETTLITRNIQAGAISNRHLNSNFNFVNKVQEEFVPWSSFFQEISKSSNPNVRFYSIKINKEEVEIDLKGMAKTRDDLLSLKEGLDSSPVFDNIYFPIKNILNKEDINFEIKADIKLDKIN